MGFWIGMAVVAALVFGLAALGNRTRRGNTRSMRLSRAPGGGQAERHATGSTVTGGMHDSGADGFS
jgi:hypothetical protein